MNEKILKLYALAQRGIGGEKVNAEKILARMLKDANLTMADLEREEYPTKLRELNFGRGKEFKKLMLQIIGRVLNKNEISYNSKKNKTTIVVMLTDLQYAEVILLWNIYSPAFKKEKKLLFDAFVQKHRIFSSVPSGNAEKLSEEEYEALFKKMRSMDDITIPRQLNGRLLEQN